MKRVATLLAVLLVVPLFGGSASAAEKAIRRYRVETSDGQVLRFRTVRDEGQRRLDGVFFGPRWLGAAEDFLLTCDDGTTEPIGTSGFSEWPWYFEGRTVTVDESYEDPAMRVALHIVGTLGPNAGSGTLRYTEEFLKGETARVCTTGDLTWTAERRFT